VTTRPKAARLSRAIGIPLTPKSVRYFEQRPYPPGEHGRARRKSSDYSVRLLEKQRLRYQYNVSEKQLRAAFDTAVKSSAGKTGETLVSLLERRLDAVVFRAGFARTIYQARQLVSHGHFTVDETRVNVPSYRVRPGQEVSVRASSRAKEPFQVAAAGAHSPQVLPAYLSASMPELTASLLAEPARRDVPVICDEQLVVEYYSR
jgi:small subunit ribosomal protein S4